MRRWRAAAACVGHGAVPGARRTHGGGLRGALHRPGGDHLPPSAGSDCCTGICYRSGPTIRRLRRTAMRGWHERHRPHQGRRYRCVLEGETVTWRSRECCPSDTAPNGLPAALLTWSRAGPDHQPFAGQMRRPTQQKREASNATGMKCPTVDGPDGTHGQSHTPGICPAVGAAQRIR